MEWIERLKHMKKQSGKTTMDISNLSGIPEPTLEKIFSGTTKDPKLSTIRTVVHALGYTLDDLDPIENKKSPAPEEPEAEDEDQDELGIPRQAYDLFYQFLVERGYVLKGDDVTAVQADFFAGLVQMVNAAFPARPVQVQKDKAV